MTGMTADRSASSSASARTYLPDSVAQSEIADFASALSELDASLMPGVEKPALLDPAGVARPIPDEVFRALGQVVDALAGGNGVMVAPYASQLTTQEAADVLGISRPTFVKLLEMGEMPYELRGRHRRVMLRDVIDYQNRFRIDRQNALDELARAGQDSQLPVEAPVLLRTSELPD